MIEILMMLTLSAANPQPIMTAQFQPCVWPNPCGQQEETVELASDYEICVWPRKCGGKAKETVEVAQFQPCVMPNPCSVQGKEPETLV
ncbi:MAG: hypothetical protein ABIJ96_07920 [Elusimicrobiota bacterium]